VTPDPKPRSEHEESALRCLIVALSARGREAVDIGCPEQDQSDPLNVDARFNIEGVEWAVEHCRITHDSGKIAAEQYAEKRIVPSGNTIAAEFGVHINLALYPPRWAKSEKKPKAFFDRVIERIRNAAESGIVDRDGVCQIYVRPGEPLFEYSFFSADDPLIRNQLIRGIGTTLLKKNQKQFKPSHLEGLPVMLLLDQTDNLDSEMTSQWLFSINLLRDVVSEILPNSDGFVSEVWLRRPDGDCFRIIPPEPEQFVDGLEFLWK